MIRPMILRCLYAVCLMALSLVGDVAMARAEAIPESEIIALEKELTASGEQRRSSVASRRTYKNVVRRGQSLLEAASEAPNRFRVLGIMFQCQKRLLALDNIERNRASLFDTCEKLAKAPDEYAEARLEADLLLSERDLSAKDAALAERARALAELIERYRGTAAEAKSLLMAALIVQRLDAPELEDAILYTLDENFSSDHEVIEFRRKYLKISRLDLTFAGTYERIDGAALVFPSDAIGHLSLMVFWSKNKPGIEDYLEKTKEELAKFSGLLDVFSFNVDELPDGGSSILREHGLDWTVMKLPGGKQNQAYRTYAQGNPVSVLVNEYGMAIVRPEIVHGREPAVDPERISEERYMAQLQSLFVGEFLVGESRTRDPRPATSDPDPMTRDAFQAIRACFVMPPFRYRLTRQEALSHYQKAEALCAEAMKKGSQSGGSSGRAQPQDHRVAGHVESWL